MHVAILTRVSKESQSFERQISDLRAHAYKNGYTIVGEYNEKITGAAKNHDRKAWKSLMNLIESENIAKVLVWELSRLGRNTLEVLKTVDALHEQGVSLYIQNYNIETLNPDGSLNPMSQLMVTLLAEFSRTERALIQQRLESGYRKHISSGGSVGRKKGKRMSNNQYLIKHKNVVKYLNKGRSIRETSKLTSTSTRTVQKVKKTLTEVMA
ncbi:recombinase family protein [Christiangramia sp. SM2212]|uniref:Recombinase family protein n=1 Tax=Christiangramia sediminicola TaxID=3073267 RepID=A0ABU1EUQ6_9FLAO|nr:recombinase family protein [Christiangramia sp. SM2212]MDR5591898.1 recombinase family protein [Christiangramia sp. SM2212]